MISEMLSKSPVEILEIYKDKKEKRNSGDLGSKCKVQSAN